MRLSISDDDICSTCRKLIYSPGELSSCMRQINQRWPAKFTGDGYAIRCEQFEEQPSDQWNWITNREIRGEC